MRPTSDVSAVKPAIIVEVCALLPIDSRMSRSLCLLSLMFR